MAPIAGFRQLNALGAFKEGRREWGVFGNMSEEQLPPGMIAVAHGFDIRHFLPLLVEYHRLGPFRVKERLGGGD